MVEAELLLSIVGLPSELPMERLLTVRFAFVPAGAALPGEEVPKFQAKVVCAIALWPPMAKITASRAARNRFFMIVEFLVRIVLVIRRQNYSGVVIF